LCIQCLVVIQDAWCILTDGEAAATRRRGAELEGAILDAAWAELREHGYDAMTLAGVAVRAGTSRPVLHRRWPSRALLAGAALARRLERSPVGVPDLGSVSAELRMALQKLADRARPDLVRLMFDMARDDGADAAHVRRAIAHEGLIQAILARGVARGEIDPLRLTARAAALPIDLARHDLLMNPAGLTDAAIAEIVDDVFLPLVRRRPAR
jgi:AcrR family transcriptional regulator